MGDHGQVRNGLDGGVDPGHRADVGLNVVRGWEAVRERVPHRGGHHRPVIEMTAQEPVADLVAQASGERAQPSFEVRLVGVFERADDTAAVL